MISFSDMSYSYGGGTLLSGVTVELGQGSFHFLTGPSGSGKTTFLKLCYGELKASSGVISAFGSDIRGMGRDDIALLRRRIGVVHQDCQFLDHLPVAENVALPATVSGRLTASLGEDIAELLGWVGLGPQAGALPPQLSGGERQRAALARAVVMGPDMVIADEPTGNLDWEMSLRLLGLLTELNRQGRTVLVATHDLNLIRAAKAQTAARVLRIRDRTVQAAGAEL